MSFFNDIANKVGQGIMIANTGVMITNAVGNGIMIVKYDGIVDDKFEKLKDKLDSYEAVRNDLNIEKVFEDFKQITLRDYDDTTRKDGKNDQIEIRRRILERKIGNVDVMVYYIYSIH